MLYCPDCMHPCEEEDAACLNCGNRRLRPGKDGDPVYLLTETTEFVRSLEWLLDEEKIPYLDKNAELTTKPYVMNVRTLHLFVPFQFYNQSLQLAKDLFAAEHAENKGYVLEDAEGSEELCEDMETE